MSRSATEMDWTEEAVARLRVLWAEGHSTAEIGRRMGVTKQAVIGKAHRLNLPGRPSPIRRAEGYVPQPRAPRLPAKAATLPQLASAALAAAAGKLGGVPLPGGSFVTPPPCREGNRLLLARGRSRNEIVPVLRSAVMAGKLLLRGASGLGL